MKKVKKKKVIKLKAVCIFVSDFLHKKEETPAYHDPQSSLLSRQVSLETGVKLDFQQH